MDELNVELDKLKRGVSFNSIKINAKEISDRYRLNKNDGERLLTKYEEAVSYALSRMPATYEAVHKALEKNIELNSYEINSVMDIGAGTGAATWAVFDILGNKEIICYEREKSMIEVGKSLMKNNECLKRAEWKNLDISKMSFCQKADLIIVSYMINELDKQDVDEFAEKLWNITNKLLLIVEPGTPHGFSNIKRLRNFFIKKGANIVAPCTHQDDCPMPSDDWCAFSCRVQRAKTHRILKNGIMGYEDEKFSYISVSKEQTRSVNSRILRHPLIYKGYSEFKVCTPEGIKNIKLSKKDGEIYKKARKKKDGDCLQ